MTAEIEDDVMTKTRYCSVGFEDGGMGCKPRNAKIAVLRARKARK